MQHEEDPSITLEETTFSTFRKEKDDSEISLQHRLWMLESIREAELRTITIDGTEIDLRSSLFNKAFIQILRPQFRSKFPQSDPVFEEMILHDTIILYREVQKQFRNTKMAWKMLKSKGNERTLLCKAMRIEDVTNEQQQ